MAERWCVLLVDDQPINLQAASAALGEEGYSILVARDGQRALSLAESQQPDLILLDVMMPEIDGYTTCRRLKKNAATRDIPVIFLTAKSEEADITEGFEAGGVDFVTKPFRHRELLARVRTHIELTHAWRHLRELNQQKSEFIAMAAHDLKNPLNSIVGFTELMRIELEEGATLTRDDGQTMNMLETVERTANHMFRLIHDLLESESIDSGRVELHPEYCDLDHLIDDLMQLNHPHATHKQIRLCYEPQEHCIAMVDRRAVREAFDNLINNAIKYSPIGANVWITLSRHVPSLRQVRFAVRDEGPGLTDNDKRKVFGRFQKLSARPTGGEVSTGLGLSIVKTLIAQQGGDVQAVSPGPGQGSTFIIDLPLAEPEDS